MALRNFLGLEPVPGLLALLGEELGCCPSCGAGLHSPLLDTWAVTQHLISCGSGGWSRRGCRRASNSGNGPVTTRSPGSSPGAIDTPATS